MTLAQQTVCCKNFVPANRDIKLAVHLTADQFAEIRHRILTTYPALVELHAAGVVQIINQASRWASARSWFRIVPIRGATLPDAVTAEDVAAIVGEVLDPVVDGFTLSAFFDEVERRPAMGELGPSDPMFERWQDEGSPPAGFTWADSAALRAEFRRRPVNWIAA